MLIYATSHPQSLYLLQANLMKKEKDLEQLICDKDQTIREQQRVIKRLLSRAPGPASPDSSTSTLATITDTGEERVMVTGHQHMMCFRVRGLFSRPLCPRSLIR